MSKELQIIWKIGEIIAQGTDHQDSMRGIVELIAKSVSVEVCNVLVYDEETHQLVLEATCGFDQRAVGRVRVSPEQGIVGHCFRTQETVNTPRKQTHPDFKAFDTDRAADFAALLGVPLVAGGTTVGVINLERRLARAFPGSTVAVIQAIASPLAIFVRNARLSEQMAKRRAKPKAIEPVEQILRGKAITDGVVRGKAYFLLGSDVLDQPVMEYTEDAEGQRALLDAAIEVARQDTIALQREAEAVLEEADAAIFYAHLLLLEDTMLRARLQAALADGFTLRSALKIVFNQLALEFSQLHSELARERLADLKDVILRIYQAADEVEGVAQRPAGARRTFKEHERPIVITRELLPSQLIRLPLADLAGILCEEGGATTHVAILAKTLRIPMIVGIENLTVAVRKNDGLLMDCTTGLCYVRPGETVIEQFRPALSFQQEQEEVEAACALVMTKDGVTIRLGGNISLINELPLLKKYGAAGVGLYRTEFMFMIRGTYPTEEEQYSIFRRVVEGSQGASVTIRLLDVGGDKPLQYVDFGDEDNPALGWRGTRFLLANQGYLDTHLRAILRCSTHGRVHILLPMVADLEELLQCLEAVDRAKAQLAEAGMLVKDNYHVGVMLEVPSAIWDLPQMLPHVDFVSIGSNDLVQYTFAVDRGNHRVTPWFRQFHPVVLRMIKQTCDLVLSHPGKLVSICGEMAGIPSGVPFLIGAGITYLSMNPWRIPGVRQAVENVTLAECQDVFNQALACRLDADVIKLMHDFARAHDIPCGDSVTHAQPEAR